MLGWAKKTLGDRESDVEDIVQTVFRILFEPIGFKLTGFDMQKLLDEGIPENVVGSLKRLKDQEFIEEEEFLNAIEDQIGNEQTDTYQEFILKYAVFAHYQAVGKTALKSFKSYVWTITHNECIALYRKQQPPYFIITAQTIQQLELAGVTKDVLRCLENIRPHQHRAVEQKTFLKNLESTLGYTPDDPLKSWILRYSRYGYKRWNQLSEKVMNTKPAHDDALQNRIEQQEIQEIFENDVKNDLSEDEWKALYLKINQEKKLREIAEIQGKSTSAVHEQYQRAKKKVLYHDKLRSYWEEKRYKKGNIS